MDPSLKRPDTPTKDNLRKHYISVRKNLKQGFIQDASTSIAERLFTLPQFTISEVIHCYVSIPENNEVVTDFIINKCFEMDKIVVIPKVEHNELLTHHQIESLQYLEPNGWGVREPVFAKECPVSQIDLVIVPMVAGDRHRNRLGYGKGYYDRFLGSTKICKIGLLFDCQLHSEPLPVEIFDIKLDQLITEKEVIL